MTDLERRVIDFVARNRAADPARLHFRTTLYGDLGLLGDDTDEFFLDFAKEFSVSLEGLNISTCFPPEPYLGPGIFIAMFRRLFVSSEPHEVSRVAPLTIGDLVAWAEGGRVTRTPGQARWA